MSDRINTTTAPAGVEVDAGLQAYMRRIFIYMGMGVGLTGLIAYAIGVWAIDNQRAYIELMTSPLRWVLMLSPFAIILIMNF